MHRRVHLWIAGRVQGVSFRYHAREQARSLGLTGWVRNLPDGRVELVAEGPAEQLEGLISWCRRGPSAASVEDVERRDETPTGEFFEFAVLRDRA